MHVEMLQRTVEDRWHTKSALALQLNPKHQNKWLLKALQVQRPGLVPCLLFSMTLEGSGQGLGW